MWANGVPGPAFRRPATPTHPRGRMVAACSTCTDRRSRRTDRASPNLVEAQLDQSTRRMTPLPSDPQPAIRLRHELAAARQAGQTFTAAWDAAMAHALETSPPRERADWRDALLATSTAWRHAYDREDALDHHQALSTLAEAA